MMDINIIEHVTDSGSSDSDDIIGLTIDSVEVIYYYIFTYTYTFTLARKNEKSEQTNAYRGGPIIAPPPSFLNHIS